MSHEVTAQANRHFSLSIIHLGSKLASESSQSHLDGASYLISLVRALKYEITWTFKMNLRLLNTGVLPIHGRQAVLSMYS